MGQVNMSNKSILSKSETDWEQLDRLDLPEIKPEQLARTLVRRGLSVDRRKNKVTFLRIDTEVLEWFKSQGSNYQTQINSLLRAHMEADH